jgi:hypothetical protein
MKKRNKRKTKQKHIDTVQIAAWADIIFSFINFGPQTMPPSFPSSAPTVRQKDSNPGQPFSVDS